MVELNKQISRRKQHCRDKEETMIEQILEDTMTLKDINKNLQMDELCGRK